MATILVEILGNAKQFKHELDGAVASTSKANNGFAKMAKVAGVAGVAIAGGVAVALTKSVEAAMSAEAATARMNAAFAAAHVSSKKFAGGIEDAEGKARKLGFTNDDVRGSLGSLIVATHDGNKAITDLGVAEDIARFKHVSLEAATKNLTMAMAGSQRATKQLGIDVPKVTTAQDALTVSHKQQTEALQAQFPATAKQTDAEHALYLAKKDTLDANFKADMAEAKLNDRHVTSAKVIQTVTEKLHGQSAAFSSTAAGGMATFHAQLNNIEEEIGKALLPLLNQFVRWLNVEMPVAVAKASAAYNNDLKPALTDMYTSIKRIVDFTHANWGGSGGIGDIVAADMHQSSGAVKTATALMSGDWSRAWQGMKQTVQAQHDLIEAVLRSFIKVFKSTGHDLGVAIKDGIVSGIEGIAGAVGDKLTSGLHGAVSAAKSALGISSPSKVAADQIGKPIAEGVIQGWIEGSASLPSTLSQGLQNAINAGRAVIQAAQASFQAAWSQIASDADAAFSAVKGAVKTPAEKALADAQAEHEKAARDAALAAAKGALDTATAGGDPAAILAAQQQLAEAQYQIHIAALQKKAEAQRIDRDAEIALQKRHFDTALANLQAHLAKGHASYKEAHAAILKLFKSFGVNYSSAGAELGKAFVTGLKESIAEAAKGSGSLNDKLQKVADGIHIPHAATGGFVTQSGLAIIHKGETITKASGVAARAPLTAGAGGNTFIVNNTQNLDARAIARAWIWQSKNVSP